MRKILVLVLMGVSLASVACGKDTTGPGIPSNGMNGLYVGSTSNADIRLQVTYGEDKVATANKCGNVAENILCYLLADNLSGTGSITLRQTGEAQSFQIRGGQVIYVVLTFAQPTGVMADVRLVGSMSSDATTLAATITPGAGTPRPSIFGDSVAVTFVRQ